MYLFEDRSKHFGSFERLKSISAKDSSTSDGYLLGFASSDRWGSMLRSFHGGHSRSGAHVELFHMVMVGDFDVDLAGHAVILFDFVLFLFRILGGIWI